MNSALGSQGGFYRGCDILPLHLQRCKEIAKQGEERHSRHFREGHEDVKRQGTHKKWWLNCCGRGEFWRGAMGRQRVGEELAGGIQLVRTLRQGWYSASGPSTTQSLNSCCPEIASLWHPATQFLPTSSGSRNHKVNAWQAEASETPPSSSCHQSVGTPVSC